MTEQERVVGAWAASRYEQPWQLDALRRVLESGRLSDGDIAELVELVEVAAGERAGRSPVVPDLLERSASMGSAPSTKPPFALGRMHSLRHVNELAPEQELTFGLLGITAIYGENGAGKSGYSRVLRHACRPWRMKQLKPVLPSVRAAGSGSPEARFDVQHRDGAARRISWRQGQPAPAELAGFAVFDGACIRPLIAEENVVTYQPSALGILPAFAAALVAVSERVEASALRLETPPSLLPPPASGSEAAAFIARLNRGATLAELDALVGDVEAARKRQLEIVRDLAALDSREGPEAQARGLDMLRRRTVAVDAQIGSWTEQLSVAKIGDLAEAVRACAEASATADLAARQRVDSIDLPGTGTATQWKALYAAAVAFSTEVAYPGSAFPPPGGDARCALCQQPLRDEARARLERFRLFVEDRTARAAASAADTLQRLSADMARPLVQVEEGVLDEIGARDTSLAAAITVLAQSAARLRAGVLDALKTGSWPSAGAFHGDAAAVRGQLSAVVASLTMEAAARRELAEPERKRALEHERDTIAPRIALHDARPAVVDYLDRRARAARLRAALGDCNTAALSRQNSKFSEEFVTAELAAHLNDELALLEGDERRLSVEFRTTTDRGETRNSLVLTGASGRTPMDDVLSEGEQRVLALAAFLAELRLAPSPVSVVADDPVTSLDHRWSDRIAERLVRLAADRQVIVFTHNISFLYLLRRHAARVQEAPLHEQYVRRIARVPGHCGDEPTWESMDVKGRIKAIEGQIKELAVLYQAAPEGSEASRAAAVAVDLLRSTWERAVEELLLNEVVQRFEPEVQTQRLREVAVTDEDFKAVYDAMSALSAYTSAHDRASGHQLRPASAAELTKEVSLLKSFAERVKKRRDALRSDRKDVTERPRKALLLPRVEPPPAVH